jgi:hypothetical protein
MISASTLWGTPRRPALLLGAAKSRPGLQRDLSRRRFLLSAGTDLAPRAEETRLPDWLVVAGHPSFLRMVGFRTTASVAAQSDSPRAWVFSGNRSGRTRHGEPNAPLRKRGAAATDSVNSSRGPLRWKRYDPAEVVI